ncbi:MAG: transposase [Patescibacteria group bacterium]
MPSRNIIKEQAAQSYYHVYARGASKQKIFVEATDYGYFIKLLERYLSNKPVISKTGEAYPHFLNQVELLAYCLMSNHFHLLVYQSDVPFLEKFMRSLMTSYSRYFNLKYKRTGSLFESRYKAVRIDQDAYLRHITRYIHLNPRLWEHYRYSSLNYYRQGNEPVWLRTSKILDLFSSREGYMDFVSDYEELRDMLAELKHQLADQ